MAPKPKSRQRMLNYSTKIDLPPDMRPGEVIGHKSSNLVWLKQVTGGAHFRVYPEENPPYVLITTSTKEQLQEAQAALLKQLKAREDLGSPAYPHPKRVDLVLSEQIFGPDPKFCFIPREDEVSLAARAAAPLFDLSPCTHEEGVQGGQVGCEGDTGNVYSDGNGSSNGSGNGFRNECSHGNPAAAADKPSGTSNGGGGSPSDDGYSLPATTSAASSSSSSSPCTSNAGTDLAGLAHAFSSSCSLASSSTHSCLRIRSGDDRVSSDVSGSSSGVSEMTGGDIPEGSSGADSQMPAALAQDKGAGSELGAPAGGLQVVRAHGGCKLRGEVAEQLAASVRHAVAAAATQQPGRAVAECTGLRLDFTLGKTLFYKLGDLEHRHGLRPPVLESDGDWNPSRLRSAFSHCLPEAAVHRFTEWLTQQRGFAFCWSRHSAALQVINQELNSHYAVALDMKGDGSVSLGRLDSSATRWHIVNLLTGATAAPGPGPEARNMLAPEVVRAADGSAAAAAADAGTGTGTGGMVGGLSPTECSNALLPGLRRAVDGSAAGSLSMDLRCKLVGQRRQLQDAAARAAAEGVVAACNSVGYAEFVRQPELYINSYTSSTSTSSGRSSSSGSSGVCKRLRLDSARKQTKMVYAGELKDPVSGACFRSEVTLSIVEDDRGRRREVKGSFPDLDALLSSMIERAAQQQQQGTQGQQGEGKQQLEEQVRPGADKQQGRGEPSRQQADVGPMVALTCVDSVVMARLLGALEAFVVDLNRFLMG